jgi:hypothetical protein
MGGRVSAITHFSVLRWLQYFPGCQTAPEDWMFLRSQSYGSTCVDMLSIFAALIAVSVSDIVGV